MQTVAFDVDALISRMIPLSDAKYRAFNLSLIPGVGMDALGVRVPALRSIARELCSTDWRAFLAVSRCFPLFEVRMLHAIVLGYSRCAIDERIALIDAFLPYVNNWAVCDALCAGCKPGRDDEAEMFEFVCACADSEEEFRKRFGLVMMMNRYRDDRWAGRVLAAYRDFSHPGYYARMGAAWGLATLFLYQREGVLAILQSVALDPFTHNAAIRKLRESRRVAESDKRMLNEMRMSAPDSGLATQNGDDMEHRHE